MKFTEVGTFQINKNYSDFYKKNGHIAVKCFWCESVVHYLIDGFTSGTSWNLLWEMYELYYILCVIFLCYGKLR